MADWYEVDFLAVETAKSGDAITLRYSKDGVTSVHVVDGGFLDTGDKVVDHILGVYGTYQVDRVVVTHNDRDHSCGLRKVLERLAVGELWMLRPWMYADELIDRFATYQSVPHLRSRLRAIYSNLAELEDLAIANGVSIREPFQGAQIGAFTVLAPSKARFLDLIVRSEKTPEAVEEEQALSAFDALFEGVKVLARKAANLVKVAWGVEAFSTNGTSAENEMSIVQFANLDGSKILLTGDAGREALEDAISFAPYMGVALPGLNLAQIPHHGSRRNVSTEVLNALVGPILNGPPAKPIGIAVVSSAEADPDHPRQSVKRAFMHRGMDYLETEGSNKYVFKGLPRRDGWYPVDPIPYPDEQEED